MAERFTLKIGDHLASAETKKYYNGKVFAEIAPRYDFITRVLSFWRDAAWKKEMIDALPSMSAPFCLDLACGTGDIAFLLAGKYPGGQVVGLDITEPMLELARQRSRHANVHFVNQDMGKLEFASSSVDVITGGYALRNAPDLASTLEEISRVLRPGGTAAFLDFSKPNSKFVQRLEYWTLKLWTGLWGFLLHRNHEVYSYIAESLDCYPDRVHLRQMLQSQNLAVVDSRLYFFGITELLVIRKSDAAALRSESSSPA